VQEQLQGLVEGEAAEQWAALIQQRQQQTHEDLLLLEENLPVIEAWAVAGGEWITGGMGGLVRMDWTAVEKVLGYHEIDTPPHLMRGLHIFSRAYAAEHNRLDNQEAERKKRR